ncbi:MAG: PP2C family protein-serine/threonine phosphatase [Gammaproteobacteria bacterium]
MIDWKLRWLRDLFYTRSQHLAEIRKLRRRLMKANRLIRRDLEQIAEVQRKLLPPENHSIPGITLAASYTPFVSSGGDYYDVVPLLPGAENTGQLAIHPRWGAIIADVSGHGPAAAVEVAMLDAILRTYPNLSGGPAEVLNYANRHFFSRQIRGSFITAFTANYDPQTSRLTYTNAGHNPPLLKRTGGPLATEFLDASDGIPLGVDPAHTWVNVEIPMAAGDILVLYTDGVTEARASSGEQFGPERLKALIEATDPEPQTILTALKQALVQHRQGTVPKDDQTIVVIQINP